jgi:hypothetical protein
MTTSRLQLYNGGLRLLGERKLASLSENREPRRYMDDAWNDGAVDYCLQSGQWKFAMRSVMLDYSPSVEPGFPGLQYAFDMPSDLVRTAGVFSDEGMQAPLLDIREEGGFWWSNLESIYVRYVSNDEAFGLDFSLWPQTFVKFVESHLASEVAMPLTQNRTKMEDMLAIRQRNLRDALSKDAMQDPTQFPPPGTWTTSRAGNMSGRRTRGPGRGGSLC